MKRALPVIVERHEFIPADFIGGHPVLDFTNTVTGRDQSPRDWLDSYSSLVSWAEYTEILPSEMLLDLLIRSEKDERAAEHALQSVKILREELFSLFQALATNQDVDIDLLQRLQMKWHDSCSIHELVHSGGKISLNPNNHEINFQGIEKRLTYLAIELARDFSIGRLRVCKGNNCSWIYLDRSKAGRRCWCDMKTCGNSSKMRRFQEKKKSSSK